MAARIARAGAHEAGHGPYLELVDAELDQERSRIRLEYQLLAASIGLIKAVGGAWEGEQVPP